MTEVTILYPNNDKYVYKYLCDTIDDLVLQIIQSPEYRKITTEAVIVNLQSENPLLFLMRQNEHKIINDIQMVNMIFQSKIAYYTQKNKAIRINGKAFSYNEIFAVTREPDEFFEKSFHDEQFNSQIICMYVNICEKQNCEKCIMRSDKYTNLVVNYEQNYEQ